MNKYPCPRCTNGTGIIKAFSHVKGGVCFKCDGKGFVMLKSAPAKPLPKWRVGAINKLQSHPGDHPVGAVVFPIFSVAARTEEAAIKKAAEKLSRGNGYDANTVFVERIEA